MGRDNGHTCQDVGWWQIDDLCNFVYSKFGDEEGRRLLDVCGGFGIDLRTITRFFEGHLVECEPCRGEYLFLQRMYEFVEAEL